MNVKGFKQVGQGRSEAQSSNSKEKEVQAGQGGARGNSVQSATSNSHKSVGISKDSKPLSQRSTRIHSTASSHVGEETEFDHEGDETEVEPAVKKSDLKVPYEQFDERISTACHELDVAYHSWASWPELLHMLSEKYDHIQSAIQERDKERFEYLNSRFSIYLASALPDFLDEVEGAVDVCEGHRHIPLLKEVFQHRWLIEYCTKNNDDLTEKMKRVLTLLTESELSFLEWRVNCSDQQSWSMAIKGLRDLIDYDGGLCTKFYFCEKKKIHEFRSRRIKIERIWEVNKEINQRNDNAPENKEALQVIDEPLIKALEEKNIAKAEVIIWQLDEPCPFECRLLADYLRVTFSKVNEGLGHVFNKTALIACLNTLFDFYLLCPESFRRLGRPRQDISAIMSGIVKKILAHSRRVGQQRTDSETLKKISVIKEVELLDAECLKLWDEITEARQLQEELQASDSVGHQIGEFFKLFRDKNFLEAKEILRALVLKQDEIRKLYNGDTLCERIGKACQTVYEEFFSQINNEIFWLMGKSKGQKRGEAYKFAVKHMANYKCVFERADGWNFILDKRQYDSWGFTTCQIWGGICLELADVKSITQDNGDDLLMLMAHARVIPCDKTRKYLKITLANIFQLASKKPSPVNVSNDVLLRFKLWAEELVRIRNDNYEDRFNQRLLGALSGWQGAQLKRGADEPLIPEIDYEVISIQPTDEAEYGSLMAEADLQPAPLDRHDERTVPSEAVPQNKYESLVKVEPKPTQTSAPLAHRPVSMIYPTVVGTVTPVNVIHPGVICVHSNEGGIHWSIQPVFLQYWLYKFYWLDALNNRALSKVVKGLDRIGQAVGAIDDENLVSPGVAKAYTKNIRPMREGIKDIFQGLMLYMTSAEKDYINKKEATLFPLSELENGYWKILQRIHKSQLMTGNLLISCAAKYIENYLLAVNIRFGLIKVQRSVETE